MKKLIILISIALFLLLNVNNTKAGIIQFQGDVRLTPFSSETFCGMGLYATDPQNGTYSLDYSDNILPFVKSISPNDVQLISIDYLNAPKDSGPRQEFVKNICSENKTNACVMTCTVFNGLGLGKISFDISGPKEETIVGQVYDVVKIRESTGKEVLQFIVLYTPFDGRILIGIIIVIIFVAFFVIKKRKSSFKFKKYKKGVK